MAVSVKYIKLNELINVLLFEIMKMKDEKADARRNPVKTETKSAISKRTMRQIANEEKG